MKTLLLAFPLVLLAGCGALGGHRPQVNKDTGRMEKPDDAPVEVFYEAPSRAYEVIGMAEGTGSESAVLNDLKKEVRRKGGDAVIVKSSGTQTIIGGLARRTMSGSVIVWK